MSGKNFIVVINVAITLKKEYKNIESGRIQLGYTLDV